MMMSPPGRERTGWAAAAALALALGCGTGDDGDDDAQGVDAAGTDAMTGGPDAATGGPDAAVSPWRFAKVIGGSTHLCVLTDGGTVRCLGLNQEGQVGDGTMDTRTELVTVLEGALHVEAGANFTVARMADGTTMRWGRRPADMSLPPAERLGPDLAPVAFPLTDATDLSVAGGGSHACAIVAGELFCWGFNGNGQLGDGTFDATHTPVRSTEMPGAVDLVSVGSFHTCVELGGGAQCVGNNGSGQLGNDSQVNSTAYVDAFGLTDTVDISMGHARSCALRADGSVWCWGDDESGFTNDGLTPHPVVGVADAVQMESSTNHTCARTGAGTILCWGNNDGGQLGDLTQNDANDAVEASMVPAARDVGVGGSFVCAIASADDCLYCWGRFLWSDVTQLTPARIACSDD
jgi:alpha-tubulin suppressor-like RCC1 family protein